MDHFGWIDSRLRATPAYMAARPMLSSLPMAADVPAPLAADEICPDAGEATTKPALAR